MRYLYNMLVDEFCDMMDISCIDENNMMEKRVDIDGLLVVNGQYDEKDNQIVVVVSKNDLSIMLKIKLTHKSDYLLRLNNERFILHKKSEIEDKIQDYLDLVYDNFLCEQDDSKEV